MFNDADRDTDGKESFRGGRANELFIDEGLEPFMVFVVFVISIRFRDFDEDTLSGLWKILFFERKACLFCCDAIKYTGQEMVLMRGECVCMCCVVKAFHILYSLFFCFFCFFSSLFTYFFFAAIANIINLIAIIETKQ